jgi:hypothetical protein
MGRPSLGGADRAVLERAGGCQPANRGRIDIVGPGHIGLRLACGQALDSLLPLMGRHLAWTPETHAALLGALAALAGAGARTSEAASGCPRRW